MEAPEAAKHLAGWSTGLRRGLECLADYLATASRKHRPRHEGATEW